MGVVRLKGELLREAEGAEGDPNFEGLLALSQDLGTPGH